MSHSEMIHEYSHIGSLRSSGFYKYKQDVSEANFRNTDDHGHPIPYSLYTVYLDEKHDYVEVDVTNKDEHGQFIFRGVTFEDVRDFQREFYYDQLHTIASLEDDSIKTHHDLSDLIEATIHAFSDLILLGNNVGQGRVISATSPLLTKVAEIKHHQELSEVFLTVGEKIIDKFVVDYHLPGQAWDVNLAWTLRTRIKEITDFIHQYVKSQAEKIVIANHAKENISDNKVLAKYTTELRGIESTLLTTEVSLWTDEIIPDERFDDVTSLKSQFVAWDYEKLLVYRNTLIANEEDDNDGT